jgi:hypothetical protein
VTTWAPAAQREPSVGAGGRTRGIVIKPTFDSATNAGPNGSYTR